MNSTNKTTPAIVGILAILAILGGAGYVVASNHEASESSSISAKAEDDDSASTAATTNSAATTSATTSTSTTGTTASGYKDGTYTATANYGVPKGFQNGITVKLTVASGKITAVSASHSVDSADRESGMYVDWFDADISSVVVGKDLASVSPSRVGGASLTTIGFDDALQSIVSQAKA